MQIQLLYKHFPESPWVSHFMVYTYHKTMFFSIECIQGIYNKRWECWQAFSWQTLFCSKRSQQTVFCPQEMKNRFDCLFYEIRLNPCEAFYLNRLLGRGRGVPRQPDRDGECHLFLAGNRAVLLGKRRFSWREIAWPSSFLKKRFL